MKDDQPTPPESSLAPTGIAQLLRDLAQLIDSTRQRVARTVNAELVLMYWKIGTRIRQEVLGGERAAYGEQIVSTLSRQLTASYGVGFSRGNLFHMIRFAEVWPVEADVAELAQHMGWSHFTEILYLDNPLQRNFYAQMCRLERWRASADRLEIDLSPTSYKPFVGTNLAHPELAEQYGGDVMANPVCVSPALLACDGFLVMGRRNASVAYYPNRIHPFAGARAWPARPARLRDCHPTVGKIPNPVGRPAAIRWSTFYRPNRSAAFRRGILHPATRISRGSSTSDRRHS